MGKSRIKPKACSVRNELAVVLVDAPLVQDERLLTATERLANDGPFVERMLQHAFNEWAVICEALGRGEQSFILHKGGIDEHDGEFVANGTRFWLYPTFSHQQIGGIIEDARPLLQYVEANRPPMGTVRLQVWAEITTIYRIREELPALLLSHLHCWSEATVRQRFHYETP